MCIICNCDDEKSAPGNTFLEEFARTQHHMGLSAEAMLACRDKVGKATKRGRKYDAMHKKIVRLTREWSSIEHEREVL